MNYDHIKGKDTLLIQNVLNTTDSLLAEYISTTRKPIEVISTYLLYDTSILTQLAKKSIALNPTFQISILAIQLKCISNLFKKTAQRILISLNIGEMLTTKSKTNYSAKLIPILYIKSTFICKKTTQNLN